MRISDWSSDVCSSDLRLQPDRDGFLSDIEVAEAADQAETIELARLLLETADQQHFAIEDFEFLRRRLIGRGVAGRLAVRLGSWGGCGFFWRGSLARGCFGQGDFLCV